MNATPDESTQPVVDTPAGRVGGLWRGASAAFLGIPFAQPPVGDLRFGAPVPAARWDGVLDATRYGATPQRRPLADLTTIPEPSIPGESTLNVNVFTAAPGDPAAKLPVLVWIHGGGYVAGSPASPWYDGRSFNRDGVVTVSVSYRLGFDGFGWIDGAPPNRGVLDQIAALEWVRSSIAAFGGDPDRVTIAGQSAGGGSVLTLISAPAARGLFRGAISQSGALSRVRPESAAQLCAQFVDDLGVAGDAASLRAVSEARIVDAERRFETAGMFRPDMSVAEVVDLLGDPRADVLGLAFVPVVDGATVEDFDDTVRAGVHRGTPLLLGSTLHEFAVPYGGDRPDDVAAALRGAGASADTVHQFQAHVEQVGAGFYRSQLISRAVFRLPAVQIAGERAAAGAGHNTWLYDFRYSPPVGNGAAHCLELPFTWDLLDAPGVTRVLGERPPQDLADRAHADWVRFIADGTCGWPGVDEEPAGAQVYDAQVFFDRRAYGLEAELLRRPTAASR